MRIVLLSLLAALAAQADDLDLFESRVRPVLARNCYGCHGEEKQFGNLRLDSRERILRGGASGPAAVAGKPAESLLILAVRHEGRKMPLGGKLRAEEIAALAQWVEKGLPWPAEKTVQLGAGDPSFYQKLRREHWSFQPVRRPDVPQGAATNPIDRFILAKLGQPGGVPSDLADKHTLARRAAYVLTGLPPEPRVLQDFLNGSGPEAYEHYVDRLISSPHFGERWARHWMDVVRFAETYGYEWNFEIHNAWRYRDYLIRAFNSDLPYDQFVREHVAGDLLADPRTSDGGRSNESVLATAFYRLGEMGHDNCNQFREIRTDVVDNQIDTLTKAFQGLTVSCARCHDHKLDPIPTEDYYALYGIINSSRPVTRTLDLSGPTEAVKNRLVNLKARMRALLASAWLEEVHDLQRYLTAAGAWENDLPSSPQLAAGLDRARVNQIRRLVQRTKLDLSDPLYPFVAWMRQPEAKAWTDLVGNYAEENHTRERFNADKFVVFADFRDRFPAGWSGDGWGLRTGSGRDGDFAVATEGSDAITGIYPAGIYSNLLSDRLNAVLRSPLFPKDRKYISLQIAGQKLGAYRLVVDDCVIGEDHELLKDPRLHWVRVSTKSDQKLPVYLELATKSDNPRLPERPEKFKDFADEQMLSPRSFWGVTRILLHNEEVEPKPELAHMGRMVDGRPPRDLEDLAQRFENGVRQSIVAWSQDRATPADVQWLAWLLSQELLTNSRNLTPELRKLSEEYRRTEAELRDPAIVYSMADVDPGSDYSILLGGQPGAPGRIAPRHFLSLMPAQLRTVKPEHSGRRELAEAMASSQNPLTARVMVNRIWHYVFGRGLVATPDNFGRMGEAPTHPELLDYLASRFMDDGWSMKKIIRLMVLSGTFRQASSVAGGSRSDPRNLLWSRYPVRRLEAEAVRDSILAVSGGLENALFGPSIQPHRDEATPYRRLFQGPLDGAGRRSVYIKVTRMEGPRFLEIFDFPSPMQTRGARDVTNVPSQSLALLNDPFVTSEASRWAERLVSTADDAVDARLYRMFETALLRPPSAPELERLRVLVRSLAAHHKVNGEAVLSSVPVWKDVAHTFFNMKEFVYLR